MYFCLHQRLPVLLPMSKCSDLCYTACCGTIVQQMQILCFTLMVKILPPVISTSVLNDSLPRCHDYGSIITAFSCCAKVKKKIKWGFPWWASSTSSSALSKKNHNILRKTCTEFSCFDMKWKWYESVKGWERTYYFSQAWYFMIASMPPGRCLGAPEMLQ